MIDRSARDKMVKIVQQYLDRDISEWEFDNEAARIAKTSEDNAVKAVLKYRWYAGDSLDSDEETITKGEWDTLYRLLLLLRSNGQLELDKHVLWSWEQCIPVVFAALIIVLFFASAIPAIYLIPVIGIVGGIALWRGADQTLDARQEAIWPFATITEIMTARRRVSSFRKIPYLNQTNLDQPAPKHFVLKVIDYVSEMVLVVAGGFLILVVLIPFLILLFAFSSPLTLWRWASPRTTLHWHVVYPERYGS